MKSFYRCFYNGIKGNGFIYTEQLTAVAVRLTLYYLGFVMKMQQRTFSIRCLPKWIY